MSLDIKFLQAYVDFLNTAFPASLGAKETIGRTDIMVYALTAKLCSLIGTRLDFLDFASQGRPAGGGPHEPPCDPGHPGGGGPHTDQGGPGKGGPHYLQMLISYATGVSTPELADALRKATHPG
jgi:hypothetical protein